MDISAVIDRSVNITAIRMINVNQVNSIHMEMRQLIGRIPSYSNMQIPDLMIVSYSSIISVFSDKMNAMCLQKKKILPGGSCFDS